MPYPKICDDCDKIYKEKTSYSRHKRIVNGSSVCEKHRERLRRTRTPQISSQDTNSTTTETEKNEPVVDLLSVITDEKWELVIKMCGLSVSEELWTADNVLALPAVREYMINEQLLSMACNTGNVKVLQFCLDHKIGKDDDYNTCLGDACSHGYITIVKKLLESSKVDPSVGYNDALYRAIKSKNAEIVDLLLRDSRVDAGARDGGIIKLAEKMDLWIMVEKLRNSIETTTFSTTIRELVLTPKRQSEVFYQKILEVRYGGQHLSTDAGITDVTTDTMHIEIKEASKWLSGYRQLLAYDAASPRADLRLYLFDADLLSFKFVTEMLQRLLRLPRCPAIYFLDLEGKEQCVLHLPART